MKKYIYKLVVLLLIICPFRVLAEDITFNKETVTLEKCIDGDTATFKDSSGNSYKTRFLAIDTPETVHPTKGEQPYGKEASNYTCNTLTSASSIQLETDPNSDIKDRYGRLLAWVYVDGKLLQESLVEQGLAKVAYLYGNYKYTEQLKVVESNAKTSKLGVWSITDDTSEAVETNVNKTSSKKKTKKKNFIEKLFDDLLAKIYDYLDDLFDNIASWVEDML